VRVTNVVPGYAAFYSALIQVGDTVEEIDGLSLANMPLSDVDKYCLGPEGSASSVLVKRGSNVFNVLLHRIIPGHEHQVHDTIRNKLSGALEEELPVSLPAYQPPLSQSYHATQPVQSYLSPQPVPATSAMVPSRPYSQGYASSYTGYASSYTGYSAAPSKAHGVGGDRGYAADFR